MKLNYFVGYPGALPITLPILFVPARFSLATLTKDNKNIHQAPLVSTQLAYASPIMGRAG